MKVNVITANQIGYKPLNRRINFGESNVHPYYYSVGEKSKSNIYKEARKEEINQKYYNKFKRLFELADNSEIDSNLFWIMKKRLDSQKQTELAAIDKELF